MHGRLSIMDYFGPMLQSSPVDRWGGVRNFTSSADKSSGWMWWVLVILALAITAAIVIAVVWKYRSMRRVAAEFRSNGDGAGLRAEETRLLTHIARLSGIRRIATIFTSADAFHRGVDRLMHGPKVASMSDAMCANLNAMLGSLREKLGFKQVSDDGSKTISSSRQIVSGSRIFITVPGAAEPVDATIISTGPSEFVVESEGPLDGRYGQVWVIRCPVGSTVWEFDATVIRIDIGEVVLKHSEDVRLINLRRFSRIAMNRPAQVAMFPFSEDVSGIVQTPHFVPAAVVEIGGAGLLIEMPMQADIGEKTIIVVKLDERRQVQGIAKVRRTFTDGDGNAMVAVELVGLNSNELAELISEANITATRSRRVNAEVEETPAGLHGE